MKEEQKIHKSIGKTEGDLQGKKIPSSSWSKLPKVNSDLLREINEGDNEAFGALYLSCFAPLVRFIDLLIRDEEESKEIAQDIFVQIYENRESIDPDKNFRGYLFKITKMKVFKMLRHKKVEEKFVNHTYNTADVFDFAPDELLMSKEFELAINIYINNLPPQRKKIFEMSRKKGMTNEEIAKELNISKFTVRNHLQTIKEGLKEFLGLFIFLFV